MCKTMVVSVNITPMSSLDQQRIQRLEVVEHLGHDGTSPSYVVSLTCRGSY